RLEELRATIELRRTRGLAAALAVVDAGHGKEAMDQIRATIQEIERSQSAMEEILRREAETHRVQVPLYLGGGSILLLALLVSAFVVIRREAAGREVALEGAQQNRREAEAARDLLALTLRSIGDAL